MEDSMGRAEEARLSGEDAFNALHEILVFLQKTANYSTVENARINALRRRTCAEASIDSRGRRTLQRRRAGAKQEKLRWQSAGKAVERVSGTGLWFTATS